MPSSRAPGWVQYEYVTAHGPHSQEIPVNTINPDFGSPEDSTIDTWDLGSINWRTMASALAEQLTSRFPATTSYNRATLWYQPTPEDLPMFLDSYSLEEVGTVSPAGYDLATQETITARDSEGYIAKLVFLDMATGNNFDKQETITAAGIDDLWAEWSAETNGWSSQNGKRPTTFIKATRTLNEALRRQYHQT